MHLFKVGLDCVAIIWTIMILIVQYQPEFEARVRSAYKDALAFAELNGILKLRMLIPVEHCTNLIVLFKQVLLAATVLTNALRLGVLDRLGCNCVGNSHASMRLNFNKRA